jgi:hypothetical protein
MSMERIRASLAYWRERRAWVEDMQPWNRNRLAKIDQLIDRLELLQPAASAA